LTFCRYEDIIFDTDEKIYFIDHVIQQVAANAEESASTSQQMYSQAEQMKLMVEDLVQLVGVSK